MTPNIRPGRAAVATLVLFVFVFMLLWLCSGCAIGKYNRKPWASAVSIHSRFYGINLAYEGTGIQVGWGSASYTVLPVSTNSVFIPKWSDTMSIGQSVNPFDLSLREYLQTGWGGQTVPTPAMKLFEKSPKP